MERKRSKEKPDNCPRKFLANCSHDHGCGDNAMNSPEEGTLSGVSVREGHLVSVGLGVVKQNSWRELILRLNTVTTRSNSEAFQ